MTRRGPTRRAGGGGGGQGGVWCVEGEGVWGEGVRRGCCLWWMVGGGGRGGEFLEGGVLLRWEPSLFGRSWHDLRRMRGLVSLICMLVLAASASAASAATFTVSGFGDPSGATCSGTSCSSLRAAIAAADTVQNAGSTIVLGAGTYSLGGAGSAGGPLSISLDTTITGAGESATTIQQTGSGDGVAQNQSSYRDGDDLRPHRHRRKRHRRHGIQRQSGRPGRARRAGGRRDPR